MHLGLKNISVSVVVALLLGQNYKQNFLKKKFLSIILLKVLFFGIIGKTVKRFFVGLFGFNLCELLNQSYETMLPSIYLAQNLIFLLDLKTKIYIRNILPFFFFAVFASSEPVPGFQGDTLQLAFIDLRQVRHQLVFFILLISPSDRC